MKLQSISFWRAPYELVGSHCDLLRGDQAFVPGWDRTLVAIARLRGTSSWFGVDVPGPRWARERCPLRREPLTAEERAALIEDFDKGMWLTYEHPVHGRAVMYGLIEPVSLAELRQRAIGTRQLTLP